MLRNDLSKNQESLYRQTENLLKTINHDMTRLFDLFDQKDVDVGCIPTPFESDISSENVTSNTCSIYPPYSDNFKAILAQLKSLFEPHQDLINKLENFKFHASNFNSKKHVNKDGNVLRVYESLCSCKEGITEVSKTQAIKLGTAEKELYDQLAQSITNILEIETHLANALAIYEANQSSLFAIFNEYESYINKVHSFASHVKNTLDQLKISKDVFLKKQNEKFTDYFNSIDDTNNLSVKSESFENKSIEQLTGLINDIDRAVPLYKQAKFHEVPGCRDVAGEFASAKSKFKELGLLKLTNDKNKNIQILSDAQKRLKPCSGEMQYSGDYQYTYSSMLGALEATALVNELDNISKCTQKQLNQAKEKAKTTIGNANTGDDQNGIASRLMTYLSRSASFSNWFTSSAVEKDTGCDTLHSACDSADVTPSSSWTSATTSWLSSYISKSSSEVSLPPSATVVRSEPTPVSGERDTGYFSSISKMASFIIPSRTPSPVNNEVATPIADSPVDNVPLSNDEKQLSEAAIYNSLRVCRYLYILMANIPEHIKLFNENIKKTNPVEQERLEGMELHQYITQAPKGMIDSIVSNINHINSLHDLFVKQTEVEFNQFKEIKIAEMTTLKSEAEKQIILLQEQEAAKQLKIKQNQERLKSAYRWKIGIGLAAIAVGVMMSVLLAPVTLGISLLPIYLSACLLGGCAVGATVRYMWGSSRHSKYSQPVVQSQPKLSGSVASTLTGLHGVNSQRDTVEMIADQVVGVSQTSAPSVSHGGCFARLLGLFGRHRYVQERKPFTGVSQALQQESTSAMSFEPPRSSPVFIPGRK